MAESDDPAVTNILEPEDQPADDSGVDEAIDNASSTQSISSSIFRYRVENGRTYAAFGSGEYSLPNDEDEQERLGTGTGIWAMDVGMYKTHQGGASELLIMGSADKHPESEVLGVDLSPIQPGMYVLLWNTDSLITEGHKSRVPLNCSFEIDDLEDDWTFKHQFDFIFIRSMIASFKSWPDILSKAFENLEPGGYIEVQDNIYPLASDDGTIHNTYILTWSELMVKAANKIGRSITVASKFKSMLEDAGFIDIVEIKKRIPMNRWPKRSRYKELGTWSCYMLHSSLEGISMGLLTRLGLTVDEVHVLLAKVRRDLLNTKIHGYWYTYDRPLPRQTIGVD
ncbi:Secondary metabolism regulator LAE1 [Fusarium oxysporum f. sp. raphani]|uniref:Secondary metabolism regulator LAE1 n=1 Tax=Fusarium oxysporum f. sp. raphani TaxID=96318 RepID=A0A8J5Q4Z9_FUSOX|nr:Secondary metabolism regulator LAE1 [Fusarium oxysporum f. sp. raphani]